MDDQIDCFIELKRRNIKKYKLVNVNVIKIIDLEETLILAYEKIKSKVGNATPGTSGSEELLAGLIKAKLAEIRKEIRSGKYAFKPACRVIIAKPYSCKKRQLQITDPIQEMLFLSAEVCFEGTLVE